MMTEFKILEIKEKLENCKKGKHNLIVITKNNLGYDESEVVRWCNVCGAIVVDSEYDGRTNPGKFKKLETPLIHKLN